MFNPFGKKLDEVKEADLEVLKSVAEGWNVEYKGAKPEARKIAKSIASFANSYGGIYFIGLEADKTTNFVTSIIGTDAFPDIIHDSVKGNLQPFPYFETFTIKLFSGKSVFMVAIPEGENPPYIHSDGKIYRRQESASDPIPETNRHAIDELCRKAEKNLRRIEKFRENDLTFSKAEEDTPLLEIFVNTYPYNHFVIKDFIDDKNMDELKKRFNDSFNISEKWDESEKEKPLNVGGNAKFDTVNTYHNSIVLRNLEGNNLAYNGMTIIIDAYGNMKAYLPINEEDFYSKEGTEDRYFNLLPQHMRNEFNVLKLLDARFIFGSIALIMTKYTEYLESKDYKNSIEIKMRLTNCWRKILHIKSDKYFEYLKKFGIPICMKSEQYFPEYPIEFKHDSMKEHPLLISMGVFTQVAEALGLPTVITLASIFDELSKNPQ